MLNCKKSQRFIIFACILLCTLLAGCGSESSFVLEETVESVQLSNLKTSASSLTMEEKSMLNAVEKMLNNARFDRNGNCLIVENTAKKEITLTIHLVFYDEDGTYRADASTNITAWQPGERLEISTGSRNGYFSYIDTMSAQIFAEFPFEGTTLMTDPQPIPILDQFGDGGINIQLEKELPITLVAPDRATFLLEYVTFFQDTIVLKLMKMNGEETASHSFLARIVDDTDMVVHGESFSDNYLKIGETEFFYLLADCTSLPKGEYTLLIDCIS